MCNTKHWVMMHACLGLSLIVAYPRAGWKRNYPVPTELPESIGEGRPCYWPICLQTSSWRTQETEYGHGLLHLILGNRPISWQCVLSKLLCHFFWAPKPPRMQKLSSHSHVFDWKCDRWQRHTNEPDQVFISRYYIRQTDEPEGSPVHYSSPWYNRRTYTD